ncbi:hypothetical protein [Anabaena azotica]|nr:hypothetical protein [Anabaena azotica]
MCDRNIITIEPDKGAELTAEDIQACLEFVADSESKGLDEYAN